MLSKTVRQLPEQKGKKVTRDVRLTFAGNYDTVIREILRNRWAAKVTYQKPDHPLTTRLVYPYVYGETKAGNPAIRIYQWAGQTATELNWKLLRLDRIHSIEPYGQLPTMDPPLYNPNGDGGMSIIYVQAPYGEPWMEPAPYPTTEPETIIRPLPKRYPKEEIPEWLQPKVEIKRRRKKKIVKKGGKK